MQLPKGASSSHASHNRVPGSRTEAEVGEQDLVRSLLSGHDIRIVLQPQIELMTGRIVGAEALARWTHPELGNIQPSRLIPLANACSLNVLLFYCIKAKVAVLLRTLMRNGCPIPIAVKASADTLCTSGLAQRVEQRLHHAGVDKALFNLELAQDAPVTDLVSLSAAVEQLHRLGFAVSMDVVDSDAATLDLLKQLPFSGLNIQAKLVEKMLSEPARDVVVRSVTALGKDLGMRVLAEGIERDDDIRALIEHGCEIGQGNALCCPLEVGHFVALLGGSHYLKPVPEP